MLYDVMLSAPRRCGSRARSAPSACSARSRAPSLTADPHAGDRPRLSVVRHVVVARVARIVRERADEADRARRRSTAPSRPGFRARTAALGAAGERVVRVVAPRRQIAHRTVREMSAAGTSCSAMRPRARSPVARRRTRRARPRRPQSVAQNGSAKHGMSSAWAVAAGLTSERRRARLPVRHLDRFRAHRASPSSRTAPGPLLRPAVRGVARPAHAVVEHLLDPREDGIFGRQQFRPHHYGA